MDDKRVEELLDSYCKSWERIATCIERLTEVYAPRMPKVDEGPAQFHVGDPMDEQPEGGVTLDGLNPFISSVYPDSEPEPDWRKARGLI